MYVNNSFSAIKTKDDMPTDKYDTLFVEYSSSITGSYDGNKLGGELIRYGGENKLADVNYGVFDRNVLAIDIAGKICPPVPPPLIIIRYCFIFLFSLNIIHLYFNYI